MRSSVDVLFRGPDAPRDVTTTNTARGVLVTEDGDRWVVRGVAERTLSPEFSVDHVALEVLDG